MVADLVPCCVLLDVWFLLRYLVVLLWLLYIYACCCLYCVALRVVVGHMFDLGLRFGFLFWCLELVCLILGLWSCMVLDFSLVEFC